MPKIFEYFGLVFFFYSNEHEPIHVHVIQGDRQLIYEIMIENGKFKSVVRRNAKGYLPLSQRDAKIAEDFIRVYALDIVQKWIDYFIMKKPVHCTHIKTRI
ncbi:MAG: DUF4160 domain-containing protein [Bacteroidales bacterium]|nr:DUF4160 domain-containing protein [Bacteroidales bacterium]MBQ9721977.1 DUF4160 domain-containing protein [Bacteroidales bacterium]